MNNTLKPVKYWPDPHLAILARYVVITRMMELLRVVPGNGLTCTSYGFSTKGMAEHALYRCTELGKRGLSLADT